MLSLSPYQRCRISAALWQWFLLISLIQCAWSQGIFQAQMTFFSPGKQFVPVDAAAQILLTTTTSSLKTCAIMCNNNDRCRVFDYGVSASQVCRLFEGDASKLGSISSSSSALSVVGMIKLSAILFAEFGLPCTADYQQSRYLTCGNGSTFQCILHTYWDDSVSMCLPQSPILGSPCQQNLSMCREDLNLTCLPFKQCGRKLPP